MPSASNWLTPPIGQLTQVRRAEELAPPDDLRIVREITAEIPEVRRPIHREHMLGHERRWAALTGKQEDRRKYCKYCPDILRPIHRYYYNYRLCKLHKAICTNRSILGIYDWS